MIKLIFAVRSQDTVTLGVARERLKGKIKWISYTLEFSLSQPKFWPHGCVHFRKN